MADLSYAEISKLLKYDAETGKLYWLPRTADMFPQVTAFKGGPEIRAKTWNARYAGKEAMNTVHCRGYMAGAICGKAYLTHRIIWLFETKNWPKDQLDHINGDRTDNRIENLREVSNAQNAKNMAISKRNKSGYAGVFWNTRINKWGVNIGLDSRTKNLGHFTDLNDAVACRKQAEKDYGYHSNQRRGDYKKLPSKPAPPEA